MAFSSRYSESRRYNMLYKYKMYVCICISINIVGTNFPVEKVDIVEISALDRNCENDHGGIDIVSRRDIYPNHGSINKIVLAMRAKKDR